MPPRRTHWLRNWIVLTIVTSLVARFLRNHDRRRAAA